MMINIGQDRMKKILCLVYLLLPISGCVSYLFRPNWRAMNAIHNCGVKKEIDIHCNLGKSINVIYIYGAYEDEDFM